MTDILGPASANAVTTPPTDPRVIGDADTYFKDCISGVPGTKVSAGWLNSVTNKLRHFIRSNGLVGGDPIVTEDESDNELLVKAMQHQIQRGQAVYADDVGTVNAVVLNLNPPAAEYKKGMVIYTKMANANTGPVTVKDSPLTVKPLVYSDGSAMLQGDLPLGALIAMEYDGTNFQCLTLTLAALKKRALKRTRVKFTSTGSSTWAVPTGVSTIVIKGWSGGGGGGWGDSTGPGCASGGSAGSYFEASVDVVPAQSVGVVVGAGGAGSGSSSPGSAGSSTSVAIGASTWTAAGGPGGISSAGTSANSPATGSVTLVTSNDISIVGGQGNVGFVSASSVVSGSGGNAPLGGLGGVGGGGLPSPGAIPGGGGGGSGGGAGSGGTGARGEVWIEY